MTFLERLKVAESIPSFRNSRDYHYRTLKNIPTRSGFLISVQASFAHYCEPRATLPLDQYRSMEMAFSRYSSEGFFPIEEVVDDAEIISLFTACGDSYHIYAYVDVKTIQLLFDYLEKKDLLLPYF